MPINPIQSNSNQINFNREPSGFSNCHLSARPDSLVSSSGNPSFFSPLIAFITRIFNCLFCCPTREEESNYSHSEAAGGGEAYFPATQGALPQIGVLLKLNFETAGDPAPLDRLRCFVEPLKKMVENADENSNIEIKESHRSENGRRIFYQIEITNQGDVFDPSVLISLEDREVIDQYWTIQYARDEGTGKNKMILKYKLSET